MNNTPKPVTGAGILSRMVMWQACTRQFILLANHTQQVITPAEAVAHWRNGTSQFGENAQREVIELAQQIDPRPMMDDSGDFKSREQNAGVEREDANLTPSQRVWKRRRARIAAWKASGSPKGGIGNWNRQALSRMSRNPNTRRNSSRT